MKKLLVVLLVLGAHAFYCFPAGQGGNTTRLYYCTDPGCASKVKNVFCNDKELPLPANLTKCTGRPLPNTVCQRDDHAFVSTDTTGICEFEGHYPDQHIPTKECTNETDTCDFTSGTSASPGSRPHIWVVPCVVVLALLALVLGLVSYRRRNNSHNEAELHQGL